MREVKKEKDEEILEVEMKDKNENEEILVEREKVNI